MTTLRTTVGTDDSRVVVVAEDDADIRDLVEIILGGLALTVVAVGDGAEALAACRRLKPFMLLLDVGLPVMDGLEVCRQVRADPDLEGLSVVLMTGRAQPEDVQAGMLAGADTYIVKPFGPVELRALLS